MSLIDWGLIANQTRGSISSSSSLRVPEWNMYTSIPHNIRTLSATRRIDAQESRAGGSSPEQQELSFAERLAKGPGLDDFIMNNKYSVYAPNPKVCPSNSMLISAIAGTLVVW